MDYSPLFTCNVNSGDHRGKEADLRWKLGCDEEALPVAQQASMEGMAVGVGCW